MSVLTLVAQVSGNVTPDPDTLGTILGNGSVASIVFAGISALGMQMRPILEGWYADRKHKREMDALNMANDLQRANETMRDLKVQLDALRAEVGKLREDNARQAERLDLLSRPRLHAPPRDPVVETGEVAP
jgi:hypothetical protein